MWALYLKFKSLFKIKTSHHNVCLGGYKFYIKNNNKNKKLQILIKIHDIVSNDEKVMQIKCQIEDKQITVNH